jgi:hypothetical protein
VMLSKEWSRSDLEFMRCVMAHAEEVAEEYRVEESRFRGDGFTRDQLIHLLCGQSPLAIADGLPLDLRSSAVVFDGQRGASRALARRRTRSWPC